MLLSLEVSLCPCGITEKKHICCTAVVVLFFFFCLFSSLLAFLRFLFGQGLRVIFYSSTAVVGQNIAPRCCCSFPWAMERKNNAKLLLLVPLEREVLSASWALFLSCQSLLWQLVLPVVDKSCSSVRTCPFRALHIATYLALRSLFNCNDMEWEEKWKIKLGETFLKGTMQLVYTFFTPWIMCKLDRQRCRHIFNNQPGSAAGGWPTADLASTKFNQANPTRSHGNWVQFQAPRKTRATETFRAKLFSSSSSSNSHWQKIRKKKTMTTSIKKEIRKEHETNKKHPKQQQQDVKGHLTHGLVVSKTFVAFNSAPHASASRRGYRRGMGAFGNTKVIKWKLLRWGLPEGKTTKL